MQFIFKLQRLKIVIYKIKKKVKKRKNFEYILTMKKNVNSL